MASELEIARCVARIRQQAQLLRETRLFGTASGLADLADELERLSTPPVANPEGLLAKLYEERDERLGVVRLERWPEGIVLWCGGEIAWRSWKAARAAAHG